MRDVPGPDADGTGDAAALAADDPEGARARVLRAGGRQPAASLPDYFSTAALAFARAGLAEQAAFYLGRAGEAEESNARLLDLAPDTARAQRVLVELVPLGAVTATALHGHLKRLARHGDAAAAHAWAREAVCAFFDAGTVPYPNVVADLLPIARSAGVDEAGETGFVLHDDLLTLGVAGRRVEVHGPEGPVHRADLPHGPGTYPWYDGTGAYVSRLNGNRAETYRAPAPGVLEVPADGRWRWPRSPAAVALTFPGAAAPAQVTLDRGLLRLVDGSGRTTLRLRYSPVQGDGAVMPPPGFWPRLPAADPEGSAALRGLARDDAARLVDAALVNRRELDAELGRVLPELTDARLLEGVAALALRAAERLLDVLRLRDALRRPQPDGLPERVRGGGLRAGRLVSRPPAIRYLAEVLAEAAETGPAYDTPHPLGRIDLPDGARGLSFCIRPGRRAGAGRTAKRGTCGRWRNAARPPTTWGPCTASPRARACRSPRPRPPPTGTRSRSGTRRTAPGCPPMSPRCTPIPGRASTPGRRGRGSSTTRCASP
ncbi:hypothetical protein [Actinomadura coerulea]|uniref:hypothetical protein n=1 Tax=Actinomadura coerulea TaxID=46159 RepID=UPI0034190B90